MPRNRDRRVIGGQPDGSVTIRLDIPGNIWALATKVAERWGITPFQGLRILLDQVSTLVEQTNGAMLGSIYRTAYEGLLASDAVPHDGLPPIDVSKLHHSTKTKSGFNGVYANGKGFRAMALQPGEGRIQKSIGTFPTAERAAWARYLFYKKHKLPYGEAETTLAKNDDDVGYWREQLRKHLEREPTDLEVLAEVNAARTYETHIPLIPVPEGVTLPDPIWHERS